MPQAAISRTIEHADIPYDKFRYDLTIRSLIVGGELKYQLQAIVWAGRFLPPTPEPDPLPEATTWTRWEDDPDQTRQARVVNIDDIDDLAAADPLFAQVQSGINAAMVAYNTANHIV